MPPARRLRRGAAAAALILGAVALAIGLCDLGPLVAGRLRRETTRLGEVLGRPVRLREVHLRLLPEVDLRLEGLQVEAAPGEPAGAPLLEIGRLRLRLAAWPLLRSLGREVVVRALEVDGVAVALRRGPDGRLSHEEVLGRLRAAQPPLDPALRERLAAARVERAALRGSLRCDDGAATAGATIGGIALTVTDLRAGAPLVLELRAAALAPAENLVLRVGLGPLPMDDLPGGAEPLALLRRAELHLGRLPLAGLGCLLGPARMADLAGGVLEGADLDLELPAAAGRLRLRGAARATGLARGALGLRADVEADPLGGDLRAKALELTLGTLSLRGEADLRRLWTAPEVHRLELVSHGLRLEDLLGLLPDRGRKAGERGTIHGPASLRIAASGPPDRARIAADLDLSEASLRLPFLRKDAQLPLSASLRGRLEGAGAVRLDRVALRLGPTTLVLHGALRGGRLLLSLDPAELDREALAEALPLLGRGLGALASRGPPGRALQLDGKLTIDLGRGGALDGTLGLARPGGAPLAMLRLGGTLSAPTVSPMDRAEGPGPDRGPVQGDRPWGLGPRPTLRERLRGLRGR